MGSPKLPQKVFIFAQPHQMCKSTHHAFDSALHLHPLPPLSHTPSLSPPLSFSFFLWNRLSPLPVMPLLFLLLLQFLFPVTSSRPIPLPLDKTVSPLFCSRYFGQNFVALVQETKCCSTSQPWPWGTLAWPDHSGECHKFIPRVCELFT